MQEPNAIKDMAKNKIALSSFPINRKIARVLPIIGLNPKIIKNKPWYLNMDSPL